MDTFDSTSLKKIGIFSSGGDAPGMNAAIRSAVRTGIFRGKEVYGFFQGYTGLLNNHYERLELRSVANILQRGGTILKSGRCPEFLKPEARKKAADNIRAAGIDALICIGGDGSFQAAHLLWTEHKIPVVGIPGTIDNDVNGTDVTVGFDTAVNTALDAIDRIRDTAASHDRLFIIEVMGRDSGFIAAHVGLAGGAEEVFIPETLTQLDQAIDHIRRGIQRGKTSSILIAAEGQKPGRAYDLAEAIRKKAGFEAKVCILGHVQRGGAPSANDRILASRMGAAAIDVLIQGQCDVMIGVQSNKYVAVDMKLCTQKKAFTDMDMLHLTKVLAQ